MTPRVTIPADGGILIEGEDWTVRLPTVTARRVAYEITNLIGEPDDSEIEDMIDGADLD